MTEVEVSVILATAASFDQRKTGEVEVEAWHAAIGDLDFEAARKTVITWYKHHTDRIMPADIRALMIAPGDEHMHRR